MKICLKIAFLFASLTIYSAAEVCADDICLISDSYWRTMLEHEQRQEPLYEFKKKAEELIPFLQTRYISVEGNRIRLCPAVPVDGEAGLDAASDLINDSGEKFFILSPLISYMTCELAELFPDRIIIGLGNSAIDGCSAENAGMIVYGHTEAFFEAGNWAARNEKDTKALFYTGSSVHRSNRDAFLRGWNSIATEADLTVSDYTDAGDTAFIDSYRMQFEAGDAVAAVFAGPHNQTVLDLIDATDHPIISEHLLLWRNTRYNVVGTIDITPFQLLAGAIKYINKGIYSPEDVIEASFTILRGD